MPSLATLCVPATFSALPLPSGASLTSLSAALVTNFNQSVPTLSLSAPTRQVFIAEFCNVTVHYTHPGQGDDIGVETWLPAPAAWTGRFQGSGGGGFVAGRADTYRLLLMVPAVEAGFSATTTDAGLPAELAQWALTSEGNLNLVALDNFGPRSLQEQAIIGKAVTQAIYGRGPDYSYFQGCSTGGRQALQLAQRHPTLYDGIMANAPAINYANLFASAQWPQQFTAVAGAAPFECEVEALITAAVAACDALGDGITDGILALGPATEACLAAFDPFALVGTAIPSCADAPAPLNTSIVVTAAAAALVNATWTGPFVADEPGRVFTPGYPPGADLTGRLYLQYAGAGVLNTDCTAATKPKGGCRGVQDPLLALWYRAFVARDSRLNMSALSHAEFERLNRVARRDYTNLFADNPDLSEFRKAGGKMVTVHGTYDFVISYKASRNYYDEVLRFSSTPAQDFYRYFEVPGLSHCFGGLASDPAALWAQLQGWVENGTAPASTPYEVRPLGSATFRPRILCPYPQTPAYDVSCGADETAACWSCAGTLPGGG